MVMALVATMERPTPIRDSDASGTGTSLPGIRVTFDFAFRCIARVEDMMSEGNGSACAVPQRRLEANMPCAIDHMLPASNRYYRLIYIAVAKTLTVPTDCN
jgi:hypothetical protein